MFSEVQLKPELIVSTCAFVVSCVSALVSYRSMRNSSRALKISQIDFEGRSKSISLYLSNAQKVKTRSGDVFIIFHLTITNCSTLPNTLVRTDLCVHFTDCNRAKGETFMPAEKEGHPEISGFILSSAPLNISARSTLSASLLYKFSSSMWGKKVIKYEVVAETSEGALASVATHILFETVLYESKP